MGSSFSGSYLGSVEDGKLLCWRCLWVSLSLVSSSLGSTKNAEDSPAYGDHESQRRELAILCSTQKV